MTLITFRSSKSKALFMPTIKHNKFNNIKDRTRSNGNLCRQISDLLRAQAK